MSCFIIPNSFKFIYSQGGEKVRLSNGITINTMVIGKNDYDGDSTNDNDGLHTNYDDDIC